MRAHLSQRFHREGAVEGGAGSQGTAVLCLQPRHLAAVLRPDHRQLAVLVDCALRKNSERVRRDTGQRDSGLGGISSTFFRFSHFCGFFSTTKRVNGLFSTRRKHCCGKFSKIPNGRFISTTQRSLSGLSEITVH